MSTVERIESKLAQGLRPESLRVEDESHLHAGHEGARGGGGHYRVTVVSDVFEGKSLIERHRVVYGILADEMKQAIHALALKTLTPAEARAR